jgi:hypothetical protein
MSPVFFTAEIAEDAEATKTIPPSVSAAEEFSALAVCIEMMHTDTYEVHFEH